MEKLREYKATIMGSDNNDQSIERPAQPHLHLGYTSTMVSIALGSCLALRYALVRAETCPSQTTPGILFSLGR